MLSATAPTIFSKKNIDRHLNHIELMVSLPRCLLRCAETVFSWSRHHLSVEKVLRWGKWLVAWQTKSQNQGSIGQDPCNFLHFPLLVVRLARLWFLSAYKSSNFWTCQVVDPKRIEKHEDPWRLVADWMRAGLYLTFPKFLPLSDNFPPKKASNIQTRNSKKKKKKDQIIIPPNLAKKQSGTESWSSWWIMEVLQKLSYPYSFHGTEAMWPSSQICVIILPVTSNPRPLITSASSWRCWKSTTGT